MIYLILAILCSAAIGVLMRYSERKIENRYVMFFVNYVVCILMARFFMGSTPVLPQMDGLNTAILIGAGSGVLYLVSLAYSQWDYTVNGIIMSNTFGKLGVLVPITMSALIFKEYPTGIQLGGLALAIAAIVIINSDSSSGTITEKGRKYSMGMLKLILVGHLFVSGITESMTNTFDKVGNPALKDNFLFYNFVFAMLSTLAVLIYQRKGFSKWDVIFGVLVGVPNYMSARFLLYSLSSLPSVVVFPVSCIGGIVMASLAGMALFGEKLSSRKGVGLAVIMVALVLLNI